VDAADESDGTPDDQALLELLPESHSQCDGLFSADSSDEDLWLDDDVSWAENSTADPSSVSTPMTTCVPDASEGVLDLALFYSEDSTSQPPASEFFKEIQTPPSDGDDDDLDLPSLDSLLHAPAPPSSEPDKGPGDKTSALTPSTAPCPAALMDNDLNRLHEERQVKPDARRIRLRIKPPKAPQIIL